MRSDLTAVYHNSKQPTTKTNDLVRLRGRHVKPLAHAFTFAFDLPAVSSRRTLTQRGHAMPGHKLGLHMNELFTFMQRGLQRKDLGCKCMV